MVYHTRNEKNGQHQERSDGIGQLANHPMNACLAGTNQQGLNDEKEHPGHHHGSVKMLNKPETGKAWKKDYVGSVKAPGYKGEN